VNLSDFIRTMEEQGLSADQMVALIGAIGADVSVSLSAENARTNADNRADTIADRAADRRTRDRVRKANTRAAAKAGNADNRADNHADGDGQCADSADKTGEAAPLPPLPLSPQEINIQPPVTPSPTIPPEGNGRCAVSGLAPRVGSGAARRRALEGSLLGDLEQPEEPAGITAKPSRRKPERTLPADAEMGDAEIACAVKARMSRDEMDHEWGRFRNHAQQNDRRCRDWLAAWRNWVASWAKRRAETALKPREIATLLPPDAIPEPADVEYGIANGMDRAAIWGVWKAWRDEQRGKNFRSPDWMAAWRARVNKWREDMARNRLSEARGRNGIGPPGGRTQEDDPILQAARRRIEWAMTNEKPSSEDDRYTPPAHDGPTIDIEAGK
jgi:hypothetical protein